MRGKTTHHLHLRLTKRDNDALLYIANHYSSSYSDAIRIALASMASAIAKKEARSE